MATELGKAYVQIVPSAQGIKGSIESVIGGEAESAGKSAGGKLSGAIGGALGGLGGVLKVGLGAAVAGVTAAGGAVAAFGKSAVDSYANYEQLVGGVDKLYGDASGKIQQFADEAYKTSGMSANQYMETATSFSAALVNSLGGDVDKAADMTDVAMRAMSDNANVFGSDLGSVQNAFQGFAKQNYTMLDNLKLGYGGTKSEMERLIADANEYRASIGESADLSIDSFADIVQAVQSVQEAQGIAGTTNKEAMTTIEGSATAVKSAWENVITAVGRGEGISEAMQGLADSFFGTGGGDGLLNQIIPRIQTTMEGIGQFISTAAPYIADALPGLLESILPSLTSTALTLLSTLGQVFTDNIGTLLSALIDVATQVTVQIAQALPEILPTIITTIITVLVENLPKLLEAAVLIIAALAEALVASIPVFVDGVGAILKSIWDLIVKYGGQFLTKAGEVCGNIVQSIVKFLSELPGKMAYYAGFAIGQFIKFFMELPGKIKEIWTNVVAGVTSFIADFKAKATEGASGFMKNIIDGLKALPEKVLEIGSNIVKGIWRGISDGWSWLTDSIKNLADNLLQGVKDALGIESPSKEFAWVGKMVDEGFAKGIEDNANLVDSALATLSPSISGGSVYANLEGMGSNEQSIVMNVYPSAGMNEKDLAREINYRLAEQTARKQAAWRPAYA
jgi:phage-related protein